MVAMTSRLNQGQCIGEFFKAEAGGRYFDHFENADRYISPTFSNVGTAHFFRDNES